MKKMLLSVLAASFLLNAGAQTKPSKSKTVVKKATANKANTSSKKDVATVTLSSQSSRAAYAPSASKKFSIADPTINRMNQRASGTDINFRNSPVVGMPKSTYGIANGKILLRNTTSTTPGTGYWSGAVGTGTSIIGTGTSKATLSVNGKSPYAGIWLWGDRRPVYNLVRDSVRKQ